MSVEIAVFTRDSLASSWSKQRSEMTRLSGVGEGVETAAGAGLLIVFPMRLGVMQHCPHVFQAHLVLW